MHASLTEQAAAQYGVVSRAQARGLGLTRHAIRNLVQRGALVPIGMRTLHVAGAPITAKSRLMAALLDAGPGAVVSHRSAAALWRVPGFELGIPEVTRPRPSPRRHDTAAQVHHPLLLPPEHVGRVEAFSVTSPERTLFDVAGIVHPARLERAIDSAVAAKLTTYAALVAFVAAYAERGRPGSTAMRAVLSERDIRRAPAESALEAAFLRLVRRYGLPEPERQVVLGSNAEQAGRVDFFFRAANVVVELDGARHHTSLLDREEDARRDLVLLRGGRRVVRLTWRQVTRTPEAVATALADVLQVAA